MVMAEVKMPEGVLTRVMEAMAKFQEMLQVLAETQVFPDRELPRLNPQRILHLIPRLIPRLVPCLIQRLVPCLIQRLVPRLILCLIPRLVPCRVPQGCSLKSMNSHRHPQFSGEARLHSRR